MAYWQTNAAEYETDYPYKAVDQACAYNAARGHINTTGFTKVTGSNVDQMKAALQQQPLSVSIEADKLVFQLYKSGVFNNTNCGTSLDHAVLVVGNGVENGEEYWLVKNSWASSWGENGYIKMAIVPGDGICGVQMEPLYPTV